MGKLTEYTEQKRKKLEEIAEHNIFNNKEMKKLFLEQAENLDFFKCMVDDPEHPYFLLKFRLDTSPLKIKSASQNPYEFRFIRQDEIEYNAIVYDLTKHGWTEKEINTMGELYCYLVDYFGPKTDWSLIEEGVLVEENGKFKAK